MELQDFGGFFNSHKNALLEIAKNSNIQLSLFRAKTVGEQFKINIAGSPLEFIVQQAGIGEDDLYCCWTYLSDGYPLSSWIKNNSIADVCATFSSWLSSAEKVASGFVEPDLWQELPDAPPTLSHKSFAEEDTKKFTEAEKDQIRESLLQYENILREELDPVKDDLELIKEKLDYLGNALDRLNRFDWKGVSLSTVIGIVTNMTVDSATAGHLYQLFQQTIGRGIGLLG